MSSLANELIDYVTSIAFVAPDNFVDGQFKCDIKTGRGEFTSIGKTKADAYHSALNCLYVDINMRTDDILSCIENNVFTVGQLERLYQHVSLNPLTSYNEKYVKHCSEFIPTVALGRQKGHSTAVQRFIENNSDLSIAVVTSNSHIYREHYNSLDNAVSVTESTRSNYIEPSLVGVDKKIDYLIYDSAIKFSAAPYLVLYRLSSYGIIDKKTRIICVGN